MLNALLLSVELGFSGVRLLEVFRLCYWSLSMLEKQSLVRIVVHGSFLRVIVMRSRCEFRGISWISARSLLRQEFCRPSTNRCNIKFSRLFIIFALALECFYTARFIVHQAQLVICEGPLVIFLAWIIWLVLDFCVDLLGEYEEIEIESLYRNCGFCIEEVYIRVLIVRVIAMRWKREILKFWEKCP
jgi:hypothetical protein